MKSTPVKFPKNNKNITFLSDDNITYVLKDVQKKLCIADLNDEFITGVVKIMRRINRKYDDKTDITRLNRIASQHIVELFAPQRRVEEVVQDVFLSSEPAPQILRGRKSGVKQLGQRTRLPGMAITRTQKTFGVTRAPKRKKIKMTKDTFFKDEGKTEYQAELGVWRNTLRNLYYNPDIDVIYNPKSNKFYDSKTGDKLEAGTKYTDVKVFFGLKTPTIIDKVRSGSKLSFYEQSTGNILTKNLGSDASEIPAKLSQIDVDRLAQQTVSDEIQTTEYTISVDSRHRDLRIYPAAARYQIAFQNRSNSEFGFINNLSDQIKGVVRIELIDGLVPNVLQAGLSSVPDTYFLLSVEEINGRYFNSSPLGRNVFGKLQFDLDLPIDTTSYLDINPIMCHRDFYPEPRAIPLTAITVAILNFNGNQVDFGQDSFKLRYWSDNGIGQTIIITWLPHQLTTGDLVYFRFTENPILDNELDGLNVFVISPTVFSVPVDSSTVAAGIAPNAGGPPVDPTDPAGSAGQAFPTIPPNNPDNPSVFFGFILKPELQNAFTFKIITEEKTPTRVSADQLARSISGY